MTWIIYSLGAAFFFALVNVLDKVLLLRFQKSTDTAIKITAFFGGFVFLVQALYLYFTNQPILFSTYAILGGMFEIFYIYFYYKAIEEELVAFAVPLFSLSPIVMAICWYFILGEVPTVMQFFGILMTIIGIFLFVSAKEGSYGFKLSKPFWYMVVATTLFAINSLFMDMSLGQVSETQSTLISRLGLLIGGLIIMVVTSSFDISAFKEKFTYTFTINEIVSALAVLCYVQAMSRQQASVVNGIANLQPVILFGMSYLLYKISPKIMQEDFRFAKPILAVVSLGVLFFGSYLVVR
jgi:uncharacterized membrane protein